MLGATKSTFSLDSMTLEKIDSLAQRWQVSKTEVLRRAVTQATDAEQASIEQKLEALRTLQQWVKESNIDTAKWQQTIKDGRR